MKFGEWRSGANSNHRSAEMSDEGSGRFTGIRKRGRRKTTGRGTLVGARLRSEDLAAIDEWAASQDDKPARAETIRRLIRKALNT
jgi:hypothetical protein